MLSPIELDKVTTSFERHIKKERKRLSKNYQGAALELQLSRVPTVHCIEAGLAHLSAGVNETKTPAIFTVSQAHFNSALRHVDVYLNGLKEMQGKYPNEITLETKTLVLSEGRACLLAAGKKVNLMAFASPA